MKLLNTLSLTRNRIDCWKYDAAFTSNTLAGWSAWRGNRLIAEGQPNVRAKIKAWQPIDRICIGVPGATHLLPPVCVPELGASISRNFNRRMHWVLVLYLIIITLLLLILTMYRRDLLQALAMGEVPPEISPTLIILMLFTVVSTEYFIYLRHPSALQKRARFYCWIQGHAQARNAFIFTFVAFLSIGALQWLLEDAFGGHEPLLRHIGFVYADFFRGDWWRAVVGPFLHRNLAHWFANMSMALFVAPIVWLLWRKWAITVFMMGNVVAYVAYAFWGKSEALTGLSCGIFTLFGLFLGAYRWTHSEFPDGFYILIAGVSTISIVSAELLNPNAATMAHLAGLIFGLFVGVVFAAGPPQECN